MKKFLILCILFSGQKALAHCPGHFSAESVCFMLDQNLVYVYHQKFEHNGPYQDLKDNKISAFKSHGKSLEYTKKARGIYEIKSDKKLVEIEIELTKDKNKTVLTLKQE
jgi:hypothetical protein